MSIVVLRGAFGYERALRVPKKLEDGLYKTLKNAEDRAQKELIRDDGWIDEWDYVERMTDILERKGFKREEHLTTHSLTDLERLRKIVEEAKIPHERNMSYTPPFSGGRPQLQSEYKKIHQRWAQQLKANLPDGVPVVRSTPYLRCTACTIPVSVHETNSPGCPLPETYEDKGVWPQTFAAEEFDDEGFVTKWRTDGREASYCTQCGFCQYYIPIEGDIGRDWGVCTNARSQYDRQAVFEHGTCKYFRR